MAEGRLMDKKKVVLLSLFDHLVLSPKEMLGVLKREGLDISMPFKAFLNGDKGVYYVGTVCG